METKFTSFRQSSARHTESGAALILTIFMLSLLTILMVGFLSSMLTERRAAHAYEDTQRAKLIAQGAVSHAVDILRSNIPDPARLSEGASAAPGENWIVNPGRLTVLKTGQAVKYIPLHTGEVTEAGELGQPRDAKSVDLNKPLPGQTTPAITPSPYGKGSPPPQMRVKWVNLLKDPSKAADADNPLTGRYAFWMDDECAKLNYNVALGKPKRTSGSKMDNHIKAGFLTPLFDRGDGNTTSGDGENRTWGLGKPQSVNLDILLPEAAQLAHNRLLAHTFLHGYTRYPEGIMDYVDVPSPRDWYEEQKFNLTFYNRSPEFNAFGLSRLFTTYIPLSLEAGPSYQHPFIYDPTNAYDGNERQVLNFNSLLGTFGFTAQTDDDEGGTVSGGNRTVRAQLDMLLAYMNRKWPGYTRSFIDKYGWHECAQIGLNALLMARMSTAMITNGSDLMTFTQEFRTRVTSVNYSPGAEELKGLVPERFYWRLTSPDGVTKLMLPQMPGPQATEVRLFVKSALATTPPLNKPAQLNTYTKPRYIQYYYEVEFYAPPLSPVVDLSEFIVKMDYFKIAAVGLPASYTQDFTQTNWNNANNLGRLQAILSNELLFGPAGGKQKQAGVVNRHVIRSKVFTLGRTANKVPQIDGSVYDDWTPFAFDAAKRSSVSVDINFRAGVGFKNLAPRPLQMIPLGETPADSLSAHFDVDLNDTTTEQVYSWQINDPRLSHSLAQWEMNKQGPGSPGEIGTPGTENVIGQSPEGLPIFEPMEGSSEKSKFRYVQRGHAESKMVGGNANYPMNRGDEYTTNSRISSPGYWSLLHTGMQSGRAWRTLDFGPESAENNPPDWLFLDMFGATYPMAHDQWKIDATLPDEFSTASFMNSTAGQVNLNSRIYPRTAFFNVEDRHKPLEAVFKNLRSDNEVEKIVDEIVAYQADDKYFDYVGEVANIPEIAGGATTQWDKEFLLRNMAGSMTTKSNTFGVWGVAQAIKKAKSNGTFDEFEKGDQVQGEKRFYALIERYVWTGRDGVPGNGHTGTSGSWDRLATQSSKISVSQGMTDTLFQLPGSPPLKRVGGGARLDVDPTGSYPEFDGPEAVGSDPYLKASLGAVTYRKSKLEEAYNPPQAAIKYRVVYFKYLDQ